MKRIYLSKEEKIVLRAIAKKSTDNITGITSNQVANAANSLKEKEMIKAIIEYGSLIDSRMTTKGKSYFDWNPKLKNPILNEELKWIITILISLTTLILLVYSTFFKG